MVPKSSLLLGIGPIRDCQGDGWGTYTVHIPFIAQVGCH